MFIGIALSVTAGLMGGGFSPAALFTNGEQGVWLDPSDLTTLFQDTAGTQPVTTAGQTVALALDKSGRGNHATQSILASRPLYALHPSSGIRNLANGSADVGNTAFWPAAPVQNGITATKIASGFDADGLPYVDVRYQGTATGTLGPSCYLDGQSRSAATAGQTFTASLIAQRRGGTATGVNGLRLDVVEETAPTTFVGSTGGTPTTSTAEVTISTSRAVTTGNQMRTGLVLSVTNGATIDVTYRIKALQFERGSSRTAYQFNYANFNIVEAPFAQVPNLLFDGIDDFLVTPTITPNTDKVQVFAGVRKQSDAAQGMLLEWTVHAGLNAGSFNLQAPGPSVSYRFLSGGSIAGSGVLDATGFAAPDTAVLTGVGDIAADVSYLRRNGVQVGSSSADQGTGNYATAQMWIGRRGGTSLPFNGRLYGLVVRFGPNLDAATIAATEAWMNTKTGAY